jgi:hypothetical protein
MFWKGNSDNEKCRKALTSLSFCGRIRLLWVDYLCINQEDIEERGHQVSLMDRIYQSASRVLISLGGADYHSDSVMDAILPTVKHPVN